MLECADAMSFEKKFAKAVAMGGMVTREHGMTGALVKRSAIPHTLSFATRLGAAASTRRIDAIEPELFALLMQATMA